ncbi:MAG TPA: hypothetical protein VF529_09255 [Solirubrobacteraceae bacterium]|jgi:hypothetical protein
MDLDQLADAVGRERFARACEWAWRTAEGTGRRRVHVSAEDAAEAQARLDAMSRAEWARLPTLAQAVLVERAAAAEEGAAAETEPPPERWPDDLDEVPHDLNDLLWHEGESPPAERMAAALAVYRAMPCYATLMGLTDVFHDLPRDVRSAMWAAYRALLDQADAPLADPVTYSLWVDFYEDRSTVKEAWHETALHAPATDLRLERVLDHSGPVPFKLKERLYERLIGEPRWHPHILTSLARSATDVYGDLPKRRARRWLDRLDVPPGAPGLDTVRGALG